MLAESKAIRILSEELGASFEVSRRGRFRSTIGDDCAVFQPPSGKQVWSIDSCVEGVHFRSSWLSPEQVARKAYHAALSDIPAMGAVPFAVLCHLGLSSQTDARWMRRFAREQARLGKEARAPIVGGNISTSSTLEVVTTVLGTVQGDVVGRSGAQVGDEVWLAGEVGLARAGLLLLEQKKRRRWDSSVGVQRCLAAFCSPAALLKEGRRLHGVAHAMLDVSDGLTGDLSTLSRMSGVRVCISEAQLDAALSPALIECARLIGQEARELALIGGEDYALLATGNAAQRPSFVKPIGWIESGKGVVLMTDSKRSALSGGFEHGKKTPLTK